MARWCRGCGKAYPCCPATNTSRGRRSDFPARPSCRCRFAIGPCARELRLARQHFRGRIPVRPFLLGVDGRHARPDKSFGADADAVTDSLPAALYQIKEMAARDRRRSCRAVRASDSVTTARANAGSGPRGSWSSRRSRTLSWWCWCRWCCCQWSCSRQNRAGRRWQSHIATTACRSGHIRNLSSDGAHCLAQNVVRSINTLGTQTAHNLANLQAASKACE